MIWQYSHSEQVVEACCGLSDRDFCLRHAAEKSVWIGNVLHPGNEKKGDFWRSVLDQDVVSAQGLGRVGLQERRRNLQRNGWLGFDFSQETVARACLRPR